jgi:integrase
MVTKVGIYKDPRNKRRPWCCRWYGEYDPATNKRRRYGKSFRLKVEAERFMAEQATAFRQGQRRDTPEDITLKAFCRDWLKTRRRELRPESVKLYRNTIDRLLSYFGTSTLLGRITPRSAAKFIAELERLDGKDGELSNWARHRALRQCKTIFGTAVVWELIPRDPFKNIKPPKLILEPWHYLTPSEYERLLGTAPSLRWKALYALAYTGGLRFGELFSLTWSAVDLKMGEAKIENRPATATTPPFAIKDYETRTIPLPKHTVDILVDLKTYYAATNEKTPYVLLNRRQFETVSAKWQKYRQEKRPWRNQDMTNNTGREFERHLRGAGIKPEETMTVHVIRKSCITNWANTINNPKVTQRLAGHADLKTTMRYYCQVTRDQKAQAAQAIDDLLAEAKVGLT